MKNIVIVGVILFVLLNLVSAVDNNLTSEGNIEILGNISLGQKITFALGEIIENVIDGWIRIPSNLNVTGDIFSNDVNISNWENNVSTNWSKQTYDTWNTKWSSAGESGITEAEFQTHFDLNLTATDQDLNVNQSNYWNNYNNANASWFERLSGDLSLKLSMLITQLDSWLSGKTTDDLTEGSSNFYNNQTFDDRIRDVDCSGTDKVVGHYSNGTVKCATDESSSTTDTNASTECSGDEVLLGNTSCWSSSSFFDDTTIADTNETTRFENLVGYNCSESDKMFGVQSNGTPLCSAVGGGGDFSYTDFFNSFILNMSGTENRTTLSLNNITGKGNLDLDSTDDITQANFHTSFNSNLSAEFPMENKTLSHCSNITGATSDLCTVTGGATDLTNNAWVNESNNFTLDQQITGNLNVTDNISLGNYEGDKSIYFYDDGNPKGRHLTWDESNDRFLLLGGLALSGAGANLLTSGYVSSGGLIVSASDIYTTGSGDDFWLGTSTQSSSPFRAYADGSMQIGTGTFNVSTTGDLIANGDLNVTSGNDICIQGGNCLSSSSGGGDFSYTDFFNSFILNMSGTENRTTLSLNNITGKGNLDLDSTDDITQANFHTSFNSNLSAEFPMENKTLSHCSNITGATSDLCTVTGGGGDGNASSICNGETTYLDGEGNCDDISGVYIDESDENTLNVNSSLSLNSSLGYIRDINDTQFNLVNFILMLDESWIDTLISSLGYIKSGITQADYQTHFDSNLTGALPLENQTSVSWNNITGEPASLDLDSTDDLTNSDLPFENQTLSHCSNITGATSDLCTLTDTTGGADGNASSICADNEVLLGQDISLCVNLNNTIDDRDSDTVFTPTNVAWLNETGQHFTGVQNFTNISIGGCSRVWNGTCEIKSCPTTTVIQC